MSFWEIFAPAPAAKLPLAVAASAPRRLVENIAGMLGLRDWNKTLESLNQKIDAAIAEHKELVARRQALALAASEEDLSAEKDLVATERKLDAASLKIERLQLAAVEAERHIASDALVERERLKQVAINAAKEVAENFNSAVAEVQVATDHLEKALAKMAELKERLVELSGEKILLPDLESNVVTSVQDQLSRAIGRGFIRSKTTGYERGNATRFCASAEFFADAAAKKFDIHGH